MARKNKSGAKKELLFFSISLIVVIIAISFGYRFSNKLADRIVNGTEASTGTEKQEFTPVYEINNDADTEKTEGGAVVPVPVNMHPVNIVYLFNENKDIVELNLEILDCVKMEMLSISFPGEISYTMSSKMYKNLTAGNVTLPQTVRFEEIYHYYGDDRAYEAGKQLFEEMLGINIEYYTALPLKVNYQGFGIDSEKEIAYELEAMLEEAVTNWEYASRKNYLMVYSSLRMQDIIRENAPVKENNESTVLDISGTVSIIHQSGVNLWQKEE